MTIHAWELSKTHNQTGQVRFFICKRCGIGPVSKNLFSGKDSITKTAKNQGFLADCNEQIVKGIHDK